MLTIAYFIRCIFLYSYLQQTVIKVNATWIQGIDKDYQMKKRDWTLPDLNTLNLNSGEQFGVWTKYQPLYNVQPLGIVKGNQSNCSLVILARDSNLQITFLYYICFQYTSKTIIHKLKFFTNSDTIYSSELIINSDQQYEGCWYLFQVQYFPLLGKIFALISNIDGVNYQSLAITDENYPFRSSFVQIQFGGSLIVDDPLFPEVSLLNSFQGIIMLIDIQSVMIQDPFILENYILILLSSHPTTVCYNDNLEITQIIPDQVLQITQSFPIIDQYSMSGWFKLTLESEKEKNVDFLSLKPINRFIEIKILEITSTIFTYIIGQNKNQLKITTYSYDFPLLSLDFLNNSSSFLQTITINSEIPFKQWHIIQMSRQQTQQEIKLIFLNKEQIIEYSQITSFNQFTGITMQLIFGSFLENNNQFKSNLQVQSFQFNNCQSSLNEFMLCHISCRTCNGPTQFNCQSCDANSFRELNPQFGTCQCLDGYMENNKDCFSNFEISIQLKETQVEVTSTCQLGYFSFEDYCIQCPQNIKSQQINCMECIKNPLTWANTLECSVYSYQQGQSVYQTNLNTIFNFLLVQNELLFMEGCLQGQWLDQPNKRKCIKCQETYQLNYQGLCQQGDSSIIPDNQNSGIFGKTCYFSNDLVSYYVSVNQPQICSPCNILNCKYCIDYSLSNPNYNSLTLLFSTTIDYNYDDIVVGCSKCYSGFQFNFDTVKCEPVEESTCIQSIIKDQTQICLQTSLPYGLTNAIQYGQCQQYINRCLSCIIDQVQNIRCVQCEEGYYVKSVTGACYLCTNPLARTCSENNRFIDHKLIIETQAFYAYLLPDNYIIGQSYYNQFLNQITTSCIDGYDLFEEYNICIQQCPIACKKCQIINYANVCVSCDPNNYGIQVRSIENNQCMLCPQYCELCVSQNQDVIKKWNPYFNQDSYLTNKCLKVKEDLNMFYVDPQFGFVEYCSQFNQCILEAQLTVPLTKEFILQNTIYEQAPDSPTSQNNQYLNFRSINTILIIYVIQDQIEFQKQLRLLNYYKQNVYSMNKTKIEITSNFMIVQNFNLIIYSFNEIKIQNIKLLITSQLQILINPLDQDYVEFYISNLTIYSQDHKIITVNIQLNHLQILQIDSVQIDSIFVQNAKIFNQFPFVQTDKIKIVISNLIIQNSVFENVMIFNFNGNLGQQIDLFIQNLTLKNITMINSEFFNFAQSDQVILSIINTTIQNCSLIQSTIFIQPYNTELTISDFVVSKTYIFLSKFFEFNTKVRMKNIQLMYLEIHDSTLFQLQNFFEQTSIDFSLNNFIFKESSFQNITIFDLYINSVLFVNIKFEHIQHSNLKQIKQSTAQSLYVLLNYITLKDQSSSYSYLSIQNFSVFSNEQNVKKIIKLNIECFTQLSEANLFQITGFQHVVIQYLIVQNQLMIDSNILKLYYPESLIEPNIFISDVQFISNILLKYQNNQNLPFIQITADNKLNIVLQNMKFENTFINYYIQQQIILGVLIHINCISGEVKILNLQLQTNLLSNSTSTIISINANSIQLTNISVNNLNNVDSSYFKFYFNVLENSESLRDFYQQLFQTQSSYGLGILTAQNIRLTDSIFEKITSYSSSIFTIVGKVQFTIVFENLQILNAQSNLMAKVAQYGCFLIDASRSQSLNLSFNRISVNYAINKLQSAFLTVNPSNSNNKIMITNSKFLNIFSLRTPIFDFNLGNSNQDKNKIIILNVSIINEETEFLSYFKLIQTLESYELNSLQEMNAVILISSSFAQIQELSVVGYFSVPMLELVNCHNIQLNSLNFYNIFTFQALIIISSNQQNFQTLKIQDIQVHKVKQFFLATYNQNILVCPQYISYSYYINQYCEIDYGDISKIYRQNSLGKYDKCDNQILSQLVQKVDGLISISYTKLDYFNLRNLIFIETLCSQCNLGLLNVVLEEYSQNINLFNIKCQNNTMSNYGCVYLEKMSTDSKPTINQINIHNSVFTNNLCNSGCALAVVDIPLQISNTLIIKNTASKYGGGILYLSQDFNLVLDSVFFLTNAATIGSVIYIEQDIISEGLLNKSYIQNNTKLQIQEKPSLISLYFSEVKIQGLQKNEDLFAINFPDYKQISSLGHILIPSNQYISEYQIFNSSSRIRQTTNISIKFRAENQYNEKIGKLINTNCVILSRDYNITSQTPLSKFKNLGVIPFDNSSQSYNFDRTLFVINPYQANDIIKQLQLQFPSISNQKYRYQLNLRSYYCQAGEYFLDNGCLPCQVQKGYYSVQANQSICQQRDMKKIKNITESEIELYEGYWRPKYDSDQIEACLKKKSVCKGGWKPGAESCEIGYIGSLCEECDLQDTMGNGKYLKLFGEEQCLLCSISWRPIISMLLMSLWSILSINLITRSMQSSNERFHWLQRISKHYMILHKFDSDQAGCLIKIALNQMLVISSIFTYQIGLQVNLSFIVDISQASLSNSYSLDCILADLSDSIQTIYLRLIVLLIIPLAYLNLYFLQYLFTQFWQKKRIQASDLYTAVIYIVIITQPDIIKYCGSLLSSRSISGIKWIQTNVSYLYETQLHYNWMYYFILPILFLWCILIPLYFAYQLYKNRKALKFRSIRKKYCHLYNEYKEKTYYWEIVKIIQRQLQILVLTLFDQNIIIKSSFLLMIQSVYLISLNYSRPFNSEQVNKLELRSVVLCIFIIISAVCIFSLQNQGQLFLLQLFQIVLVILVASNLIPIFLKLLNCYIHQYFDKLCLIFADLQRKFPSMQRFFKLIFGKRQLQIQRTEIVKARFAKVKEYLLQKTQKIIKLKYEKFIRSDELQKIIDIQTPLRAQKN